MSDRVAGVVGIAIPFAVLSMVFVLNFLRAIYGAPDND